MGKSGDVYTKEGKRQKRRGIYFHTLKIIIIIKNLDAHVELNSNMYRMIMLFLSERFIGRQKKDHEF